MSISTRAPEIQSPVMLEASIKRASSIGAKPSLCFPYLQFLVNSPKHPSSNPLNPNPSTVKTPSAHQLISSSAHQLISSSAHQLISHQNHHPQSSNLSSTSWCQIFLNLQLTTIRSKTLPPEPSHPISFQRQHPQLH